MNVLAKQLAARVREVFINGTFIAYTNYQDQLQQIDFNEANTKLYNLNTIAMLTFHLNYYLKGLNQVFDGGSLDIRDKYSYDMEPIVKEDDWQALIKELLDNAERFASHVEQMPDDKLTSDFVDKKYGTYLRNIDAMIEHAYYHLGQISIIRKSLKDR